MQLFPDSFDSCIPRNAILFRIILVTVDDVDTTESYIGKKIVALWKILYKECWWSKILCRGTLFFPMESRAYLYSRDSIYHLSCFQHSSILSRPENRRPIKNILQRTSTMSGSSIRWTVSLSRSSSRTEMTVQRRCSIGCDEFLAINVVLQRSKAMNNEGTITTRGLSKRFSRHVSWTDRAEVDHRVSRWNRRIGCSSCGGIHRWEDLSCNKSRVWYRTDRCSRTNQHCCREVPVPPRDIVSSGNTGNRLPLCKCHRKAGNRPDRSEKLDSACWRSR